MNRITDFSQKSDQEQDEIVNLCYNQISRMFEELRNADKLIGHQWKMPTPEDSLAFAITECGELTLDEINAKKAGYARNNQQKTGDPAKEMADIAMMVAKFAIVAFDLNDDETVIDFVDYCIEFIRDDSWTQDGLVDSIIGFHAPDSVILTIAVSSMAGIYHDLINMDEEARSVFEPDYIDALVDGFTIVMFVVTQSEYYKDTSFIDVFSSNISRIVDKNLRGDVHIV